MDGGGHAQTNPLTGTILPPPGWADLTREPENSTLRGAGLRPGVGRDKGDGVICGVLTVCECVWGEKRESVEVSYLFFLLFLRVLTFALTPALQRVTAAVFINLLSPRSHPPTHSLLSLSFLVLTRSVSPFLFSRYMCFSLCPDVILLCLLLILLLVFSPSLHSSVLPLFPPL